MQWTELPGTQGLHPKARINDIAVASDRRWAVSSDGRLFSWVAKATTTPSPLANTPHARAIAFDSAGNVGWIGLFQRMLDPTLPRLLKTIDGGVKWSAVMSLPQDCAAGFCGLSVVHPELAFGCGTFKSDVTPAVTRTTNGTDWEALKLPPNVNGLTDIEFWTEKHGMLIGQKLESGKTAPVILLTDNGGKAWQRAHIADTLIDGAHAWKVHRCCDKIAYVTVAGTGTQGVVLKSTDGGQSWNALSVNDPSASINDWQLQGVGFVEADHGWVGQQGGAAFETVDGGQSWHPASGVLANLNRFAVTPEGFYATGAAIYLGV